jgi:hypothetical protein
VVTTPSIPTPRSQEVESEEEEEDEAIEELANPEEQATRRSESPAAKRQRELVQMTSEDALRVIWRRSVQLPRRSRGCPQRLVLGCLSRRLGSLSPRGKFLIAHSFCYLTNACLDDVFAVQAPGGAAKG